MIMSIKKNDFNPKIIFRFLENIWQKRDHRESEACLKAVYNGESIPHSFTEMMFLKAYKAYEIICNNEEISLSKASAILNLYKPNIVGNDDTNKSLLALVEKIKEAINTKDNWLENFLDIYKFCILCDSFKDYEIEIAKLFSNYSLLVNGTPPIIMYCYLSDRMADIIRYGNDEKELYKIMEILIQRTKKFNTIHKIIPLHDIKAAIYGIHDELVTEYGIKHLGIFGSYARNEPTKYSDLDIICEVRKDFRNIENLQELIEARIKDETGLDVDVMIDDITYDKNQIPVDMFKENINLF